MKIPTKQLLELIAKEKHRVIEASLNNGTFNATHFLSFRQGKIVDTGIDSATAHWKPDDFLAFYPTAYWKIDQIV
ncbi:MAG: hypothetical protein HY276_06555 [Ignavibacteriales bacterium]|nr:hypothetical protein [Ignavibacteriales bacterium]